MTREKKNIIAKEMQLLVERGKWIGYRLNCKDRWRIYKIMRSNLGLLNAGFIV